MTTLSERQLELRVDQLRFTGLTGQSMRVSFKASKSLTKEPNTCDVKIYNLTREHRDGLSRLKAPTISLIAGYKGETTHLFLGSGIHVEHERSDGDIITTVSTTDGGDKAQKSRVNQTFGPKAKISDVLRALAKALGVKPGNLDKVAAQLRASGKADVYLQGVTVSGSAYRELTALVRSAGLTWSIQDGALQFLDPGASVSKFAPLLGPDVLLGATSVSSTGLVKGTTFIQGDFLPGRQVILDSDFVKGAFVLQKCDYSGDTHADEWSVEFEGKAVKRAN